ncbi:monovalent cation/H(+) antiporter subunit G [Helicovermis profundi]|uniref:Monovalent cation/H(+) antiporter subunit G n=1 Tax=Helicovermis profundi TaxID=3065157 RepID=A0AAU9E472_9FIRM|nr:monovalent cation/H(+) antiporter subunit G [Clostridia bacterium S502]
MIFLANFFLIVGAFFYAIGGLGVFRMPDVYNRSQAATKATTLGTLALLIGIAILNPSWTPKLLLIAVFIAITNPIGSSALIRSAYLSNIKVDKRTKIDELKDFYNNEEEENYENN